MVAKARVLFLCTGNSCRSQMAEGFLRHLAGDRFEVVSPGIEPTPVNKKAIEAMAEMGIDISTHTSKAVGSLLGQRFSHVTTVCDRASERCPIFSFALQRLEWPFPDPAAVGGPDEVRTAAFRSVRDRIRDRVEAFLGQGLTAGPERGAARRRPSWISGHGAALIDSWPPTSRPLE